MALKVLMLGWELPPHNSGGLGVACLGLSQGLAKKDVKITFVLPKKVALQNDFMELLFANIKSQKSDFCVYKSIGDTSLEEILRGNGPFEFLEAALAFRDRIKDVVSRLKEKPDIIHAHDWLTFLAGIEAKRLLNRPLIAHFHSTEFDRTGGHYPNQLVYQIEKEATKKADKVIAVSSYTRSTLARYYDADNKKIDVVHNGVNKFQREKLPLIPIFKNLKKMGYKIVLFLGRITLQKGPEYFVRAAKKVSEKEKKAIFVVTGSGDMQGRMMTEAARLGIVEKILFTGFLRGAQKHSVFQSADLYVMPSVSEPFGITALESISNDTPVLVSKQSGVSEVLNHALKVDFWDVDEMTNKILAVLKYESLKDNLNKESAKEIVNINWDKSADSCLAVYKSILGK